MTIQAERVTDPPSPSLRPLNALTEAACDELGAQAASAKPFDPADSIEAVKLLAANHLGR